jgi:hypothetical protein
MMVIHAGRCRSDRCDSTDLALSRFASVILNRVESYAFRHTRSIQAETCR